MSKKLEGNGLWESSRMMLPEHKEAIRSRRKRLVRHERPELDPLELERIGSVVTEAAYVHAPIALKLYGEYGHEHVCGTVQRMDPLQSRFQLVTVNGEQQWIDIVDVLEVERTF